MAYSFFSLLQKHKKNKRCDGCSLLVLLEKKCASSGGYEASFLVAANDFTELLKWKSKFWGIVFQTFRVFFFWLRWKLQLKGKKEMRTTYIALLAFISKSLFVPNSKLWPFFSFKFSFYFHSDSGMILWVTSTPFPSLFYRINPVNSAPCLINFLICAPFWHCKVLEYFHVRIWTKLF